LLSILPITTRNPGKHQHDHKVYWIISRECVLLLYYASKMCQAESNTSTRRNAQRGLLRLSRRHARIVIPLIACSMSPHACFVSHDVSTPPLVEACPPEKIAPRSMSVHIPASEETVSSFDPDDICGF
jgi:hypothetical protein